MWHALPWPCRYETLAAESPRETACDGYPRLQGQGPWLLIKCEFRRRTEGIQDSNLSCHSSTACTLLFIKKGVLLLIPQASMPCAFSCLHFVRVLLEVLFLTPLQPYPFFKTRRKLPS